MIIIISQKYKEKTLCKTVNTIPATIVQIKRNNIKIKQCKYSMNELYKKEKSFHNHTKKFTSCKIANNILTRKIRMNGNNNKILAIKESVNEPEI